MIQENQKDDFCSAEWKEGLIPDVKNFCGLLNVVPVPYRNYILTTICIDLMFWKYFRDATCISPLLKSNKFPLFSSKVWMDSWLNIFLLIRGKKIQVIDLNLRDRVDSVAPNRLVITRSAKFWQLWMITRIVPTVVGHSYFCKVMYTSRPSYVEVQSTVSSMAVHLVFDQSINLSKFIGQTSSC